MNSFASRGKSSRASLLIRTVELVGGMGSVSSTAFVLIDGVSSFFILRSRLRGRVVPGSRMRKTGGENDDLEF